MCTVLLRLDPGAQWPLLLAAVRDELTDRPWEPPGEYWPEEGPGLVGGLDRLAGGTWLAVRDGLTAGRGKPGVAAVLNGRLVDRLEQGPPGAPPSGRRPSRGRLPLRALTAGPPGADELRAYEVVHLLVADADGARLISWDGREVRDIEIPPGDHVVTNEGIDVAADPLVPHFAPLLARAGRPDSGRPRPGQPSPDARRPEDGTAPALAGRDAPSPSDLAGGQASPASTAQWWGDWEGLLRGDGLAGDDPRALVVRHDLPDGRVFASTSATLLALAREPGRVRMDFTATPATPAWERFIP
ncbi:hypothetical protein GCM10028784_25170 [Myceligenerans cantabricum]